MKTPGSSVTLRSFKTEMDAHLAMGKLASEGIRASVHRFSRYRAMAGGGYQLKVPQEDLHRARAILGAITQDVDMDEYVSDDDDSYVRCPQCGSVNVTTAPLRGTALGLAIASAGVALLFLKRERSCRKCGHAWLG